MSNAIEIQPPVAVTMTDAALTHVQKQIAKRGAGIGVRLGVKKVGCSGYAYVVDFIDEASGDDHVFPVNDEISVVVDPEHLSFVKGTRLDFRRQGLNEGFEFINPNVKDMCGCGESFNIK